MDGTLLNSDASLNQKSAQRLNSMLEQGLLFTFITARDWPSSFEIMKDVKINLPVSICNGGAIIDFKTGQVIKGYYIHNNSLNKIYDIAEKHSQMPKITMCENSNIRKYKDGQPHLGEVISIAFVDQTEHILTLMGELSHEIGSNIKIHLYQDPFDKTIRILDLVSNLTSKGTAALDIAEFCGCYADRIISFGNDQNDLELLEISGLGAAVGNAPGKWKEYADIYLDYDNGDSVINYIERHYR